MYDLTVGNGFRCLREFEVSKFISVESIVNESKTRPKVISSQPAWKMTEEQSRLVIPDEDQSDTDIGIGVVGLFYWCDNSEEQISNYPGPTKPMFVRPDQQPLARDTISGQMTWLIAVTQSALVAIDCHSCYHVCDISFQKSLLSSVEQKITVASSVAFSSNHSNQVWCVIHSPFQESLFILCLDKKPAPLEPSFMATPLSGMVDKNPTVSEAEASSALLIVLSRNPLVRDSPLKAELVPKGRSTTKKTGLAETTSSKCAVRDQPLTFHSKIKSSGYTSGPRTKMFIPKIGNSTLKTSKQTHKPTTAKSFVQPSIQTKTHTEYPVHSSPPIQLKASISLVDKPVAITRIKYSGDGQRLACCLSDGIVHCLKMPLTTSGSVLRGHNGCVTSASWSHSGKWLLTASTDKVARLWSVHQPETPLVTVSEVQHNFKTSSAGKTVMNHEQFSKEITEAQFFYIDKFFLIVSGNCLYLYKYCIDTEKPDDVKRYQNNSRYKLVKTFQQQAQQITAMSCVNEFHSYIILCAGSNKNIEVYDMNVGRSARVMQNVHCRPVHCISQNKGSAFVSHPSDAYDLFVTAAVTDGIKLWDLRTDKCVRHYEGHANRFHPVGIAISPCARFIGTGSEDKAAYLFDIRSPTYTHKLLGHTDVVSDVAFHPLYSQFSTSSVAGKLTVYADV